MRVAFDVLELSKRRVFLIGRATPKETAYSMLREQEIRAARNLVDNHVDVMKEGTLYVGVTTMEQKKGVKGQAIGVTKVMVWEGWPCQR